MATIKMQCVQFIQIELIELQNTSVTTQIWTRHIMIRFLN